MKSNVVALLIVMVFGCDRSPTAPAPQPTNPTGPRIVLPNGTVIQVELATDDATRGQGLMYRDQLRPGTGMLFLFPRDGEYPFWMKNTLIPLDILWIDQQKRVVHVKENVEPCRADPCPNYPPNAIARYVLELSAGASRQYGLKVGDVLRFEGMENVVVR